MNTHQAAVGGSLIEAIGLLRADGPAMRLWFGLRRGTWRALANAAVDAFDTEDDGGGPASVPQVPLDDAGDPGGGGETAPATLPVGDELPSDAPRAAIAPSDTNPDAGHPPGGGEAPTERPATPPPPRPSDERRRPERGDGRAPMRAPPPRYAGR